MGWYVTLLFCGLFLIGIEIFVPGGVLGALGVLSLVAAGVIGFVFFSPLFGVLSFFLILVLAGVAIYVWMNFFPKSPIGKALSLTQNISVRDQEDSPWEFGMKGTALSALRPAGKAQIKNHRVDVIAEDGTWIKQDAAIEVVRVEGNRVYVREVFENWE